jgi:hypothetical protein
MSRTFSNSPLVAAINDLRLCARSLASTEGHAINRSPRK